MEIRIAGITDNQYHTVLSVSILDMDKTSISCIILAGGEGKRFDRQDKGLIELDNKPLIEHIIDRVRPQLDDIVISATRNENTYKKYAKKVIGDKNKNFFGPLAGVSSCINECRHEWILVIPCDTPLLPDDLVSRLSVSGSHKLIVAKSQQQRQLIFLMHASLKENLNEFLLRGHQKAMSWIEMQNPKVVTFSNAGNAFSNINTQTELDSIN